MRECDTHTHIFDEIRAKLVAAVINVIMNMDREKPNEESIWDHNSNNYC
jgi:hypothetical protein